MLVDDHDIVRSGLKSLLEIQPGLQVVAEAGNGAIALQKAAEIHPDVIVMDITMPEMDGLQATRKMKETCPECLVLALTVHEDKEYFFAMLEAGAKGYITKQAASDELVAAIRSVAAGHVYLQPALARWLLDDYRRLTVTGNGGEPSRPGQAQPAAATDLDVLSNREQQVLQLVAEGLTSPQIAEKLGISPKTISRHRDRIMKRLNLHSSTDLVKFAIRTGLIEIR